MAALIFYAFVISAGVLALGCAEESGERRAIGVRAGGFAPAAFLLLALALYLAGHR